MESVPNTTSYVLGIGKGYLMADFLMLVIIFGVAIAGYFVHDKLEDPGKLVTVIIGGAVVIVIIALVNLVVAPLQ